MTQSGGGDDPGPSAKSDYKSALKQVPADDTGEGPIALPPKQPQKAAKPTAASQAAGGEERPAVAQLKRAPACLDEAANKQQRRSGMKGGGSGKGGGGGKGGAKGGSAAARTPGPGAV